MSRSGSALPGPAANLLLVAGTLVVLLPAAELLVRVVSPQTLPSQESLRAFVLKGMYVPDEEAGYRLAPNFSGRIERNAIITDFSTNSLGLRAGELGAKDRTRILAFGDSFTWGWGVAQGEEWIHVVQEEINGRIGTEVVETVNCGVNGYGTENALRLFERIAPALDPDLVLLGFFANDFTDNYLGAKGIYSIHDGFLFDHFSHEHFQESLLARECHLYRLLQSAWETLRVKYLGGVPSSHPARNFSEAEFEKGRDLSEQYILEMARRSRELKAAFAVVWLPADVYALRQRRPQDIPLRYELQKRIAAAGVPSIDLLPVLTAETRLGGLYLPRDGHFSVRGNRVAGRAVADWILDTNLLEGALRHP